MRRLWPCVLVAMFVTTVAIGAQGTGRGAAAPQPTGAAAVGKTITLDGCIQNAPAAAAGAPAAATKFVLAVRPAGGAGGGGGTRYQLDGDDKAIAAHLNHQVEVRGLVQGAAGASAATTGSAAPTLTLKVEWVKMVAAICS